MEKGRKEVSKEEREALADVLIYILTTLYPLGGQIPDRIQKDIAILQGAIR